ncbi:hypothetical protein GCM10009557_72390 [Virgisporangium ochraceum]
MVVVRPVDRGVRPGAGGTLTVSRGPVAVRRFLESTLEGLDVREPSRADRCSVHRDGSVLHLVGDIDIGNWSMLRERVAAEIGAGVRTLDLTAVRYFGAAGVRVVLDARPSGGTPTVRCAPAVYRVMRISDLLDEEGLVVTDAAVERGGE